MNPVKHVRRIRLYICIVIVGLVLSGVTAFPLSSELHWLLSVLRSSMLRPVADKTRLLPWIERVNSGLDATNRNYPSLAYGTDWLAFAHLVIAVAFMGRGVIRSAIDG